VVSQGAGAEMRRTLGTAVFAGMLGVTLFGIFLTPVFYYVIQWVNDRRLLSVAAALVSDEPEPDFSANGQAQAGDASPLPLHKGEDTASNKLPPD